eukprot:436904-Amphidinium_carterae.2
MARLIHELCKCCPSSSESNAFRLSSWPSVPCAAAYGDLHYLNNMHESMVAPLICEPLSTKTPCPDSDANDPTY